MKVARVNAPRRPMLSSPSGIGGDTALPALDDLTDVDTTGVGIGDTIVWTGTEWVPGTGGGGFPWWFNVEDYGAVHDGVTDDTPAIQDALDACMTAGGGTVFFPNGIYAIKGALQATSTYNSQLTIAQNAYSGSNPPVSIRLLGMGPNAQSNDQPSGSADPSLSGAILLSDWNGSISGSPAVIAAGKVDALAGVGASFNWVFVHFESIEIRTHANPKLTAIQMRSAATVSCVHVTLSTDTDSASMAVPSNSNAIGLDMPYGFNSNHPDQLDDVFIDGYYYGARVSEQANGDVTFGHCTNAMWLQGGQGSPTYLRHSNRFGKVLVFSCPRGLVFSDDVRWVTIQQLMVEHDDTAGIFDAIYDIDDASNYARGFIGYHTSEYTAGPDDDLRMNGGTALSLHSFGGKRWKLNNVVDVPTGTDPSTNPADGFRLYAASATGKPTTRNSAGTVTTIMREGDTAGGDLSGTYPSPSVVDDSHNHTAATVTGVSGSDHQHIMDVLVNGDGATVAFTLPAAPFDAYSVAAYVAGVLTEVTLSGVMLDTATFGAAPGAGTNNVRFDIVAAL